jgi:hypothetical protein
MELACVRRRGASFPAPIGAIRTSARGEAGEACAGAPGGSSMISLACTGFAAAGRLSNRSLDVAATASRSRCSLALGPALASRASTVVVLIALGRLFLATLTPPV